MFRWFAQFKKKKNNLVTACVTCISLIKDFSIPNAVTPVCRLIRKKKFSNILILSTYMTSRIRMHEKILQQYVRYVKMDYNKGGADHESAGHWSTFNVGRVTGYVMVGSTFVLYMKKVKN